MRARLGVADVMELMAVLAIGHPAGPAGELTGRKPLDQLLLKEL